jgi:hypothetical protein
MYGGVAGEAGQPVPLCRLLMWLVRRVVVQRCYWMVFNNEPFTVLYTSIAFPCWLEM